MPNLGLIMRVNAFSKFDALSDKISLGQPNLSITCSLIANAIVFALVSLSGIAVHHRVRLSEMVRIYLYPSIMVGYDPAISTINLSNFPDGGIGSINPGRLLTG